MSAAPAVLPSLALHESRRIALHPVPTALALAATVPLYLDPPRDAPDREMVAGALAFVFLFLLPVTVIFSANLVASSARRAGAEEMLAALPTGPGRRALAVCAGGVGVAAVGTAAALAQYLISHQNGWVVVESYLNGWEVVCASVMYLGAVAFGVAVARWLPWPGAALLGVVGLVLWTYSGIDRSHVGTAPYVLDQGFWGDEESSVTRVSDAWHAGYLAALTALAVAAAALRERPARLLVVGGGLAGVAALLAVASVA